MPASGRSDRCRNLMGTRTRASTVREAAMHPLAGGVLAALEPCGDLGVGQLAHHAQLHRGALGPAYLPQRLRKRGTVLGGVGQRLDPGDRLLVELRNLDPEPTDRSLLNRLPAEPVRELLGRDSVEPPGTRPAQVAKAPAPLVGDRERLGEQVRRDLRVEDAPVEVGEEPLGPAVVELSEGPRVGPRGDDQLGVGRGHHSITPR
jgi:hypothetical protein